MSTENKEISMRSTKKEMFDLIKQLQKERDELEKSKLNPQKIKEETQKEAVVKKADEKTESDLGGAIHSLKVAIGRELTTLSDKIEAEAEKYRNIKKAIAMKERELEEIYEVEKALAELAVILEAQKTAKEQFELEIAENKAQLSMDLEGKKQKLEEEIATTKAAWDKEKKEHAALLASEKEKQQRERQREQEEYDYEINRTRQLEKNNLADELDALEKEITLKKESFAQETQRKTNELDQREKIISQREATLTELQQQVDTFPAELEAAINEAVAATKTELTNNFAKNEELLTKGFEGEKNVLLAKITALETLVTDQSKQITKLTEQQEKAYEKVQDIASKAVAGASERSQRVLFQAADTASREA